MKRRLHWGFYAAALISTIGMWAQWPWVKGVFDGWFPLFCVVSGQLMRARSGLEPDIFDRVFKNAWAEKFAAASIAVMIFGLAGAIFYYEKVHKPAADRQAIEEFKSDYAKWKEAGK